MELTAIGIGTWAIGGGGWKFGWGQQDETDSIRAIQHGVSNGINWVDTAAVYGAGHSEVIVGRAVREISPNDRPLIATKCGRIIQEDGTVAGNIKRESVLAECDASLQRLGVEAIDLYQLHWPDPDADIEEAWGAMAELKHAGKVREIGVSNHSVAQMKRLQAIHPIETLQPPYSMIARGIEDEILAYCGTNDIKIICYSPMGKGLLTGAFTAERAANLPESDHRSRDPKFRSPQLEINLSLVEGLKPIADRNGRTLAELSIVWTLRRPEVTSAIVGARAPHQIDGVINALDWRLSNDEVEEIESLLKERQRALDALGPIDMGRV